MCVSVCVCLIEWILIFPRLSACVCVCVLNILYRDGFLFFLREMELETSEWREKSQLDNNELKKLTENLKEQLQYV